MRIPERAQPSTEQQFKRCTCCDFVWVSRDAFLTDPANKLVGYQVNFRHLELGAFLFNHDTPSCRSTIAVPVRAFSDLYDGPVYEQRRTESDECPTYCLYQDNLERCPAECECAYVREVLQILRNWPKRTP